MTSIIKNLKNYTWEFDEDKKMLFLERDLLGICDKVVFEMDRTRMFSLFRFLVRISQKMSSKRRVKKNVELSSE
jgi:hypothetical protein